MDHARRTTHQSSSAASGDLTRKGTARGQSEQVPGRGHRIGSDPSPRSDADIRAALDAELAHADDFDPNAVDLLVSEGIVVMLGSVPDYAAKRRLEDVCAHVRGVREIHDQLQVVEAAPSQSPGGLRTEAPRAGSRGRES